MSTFDPQFCASLLRTITDRIAAIADRPGPEQDISAVINWLRKTSREVAHELRVALREPYPMIGWVGEEERPQTSDTAYWVYDPIDGAYHFLQGLPLWSSSLALMRGDRVIFALVYDPTFRELFMAQEGLGAMLNGRRLLPSTKTTLPSAVLGTAIPPIAQIGAPEHTRALALLGAVSRQVFVVRQMASASLQLAYVAAGRLDGYWEVGQDTPDWLAGALLVTETGATVSDLNGNALGWNTNGVLAAPHVFHAALLPILASTSEEPLARNSDS